MSFTVEPWSVTEDILELDALARSESVFALSNGHIGLRGNLDEGEPFGLPGTYLNGFYETRPLPYAEAGYGYPEDGQTVVNATNGKLVRLLVDDEPFDIRYGELLKHVRTLDLRAGQLRREVHWRSPSGREVAVKTTRIVSFTQRSVAAIHYEVRPLDGRAVRVVALSELVANEPGPDQSEDPRAASALRAPLVAEQQEVHDLRVVLVHRTKQSGLRMAAGIDHVIEDADGVTAGAEAQPDLARVWMTAEAAPEKPLRFVKFLAYGWSSRRSLPSVRDQVAAAVASARRTGWEALEQAQRDYMQLFWNGADVEIEGDEELQQALRWRHATLELAQERARQLGLDGAAFPWRTIGGEECSAYWPAGTAAFHINADIADAVVRYLFATRDEEFEGGAGLHLLVETARLWLSLGHHDHAGQFHIDGVTGPDEYSAVVNDNVYTNLMAEQNLRMAADVAARHYEQARGIGVDEEEIAAWREAAADMHVPYDRRLGIHPQDAQFTHHDVMDLGGLEFPLLLHVPYFQLYRKQVCKQPDLVMALFLRGDRFTLEEKRRDFAYYEPLTVRDSSLSACVQAVVAAEVGHLELAYDYFGEAALMDLGDLEHNTSDGLHMASLAGSWIAAVAGFGGMRNHGDELRFHPRLPVALSRLRFRVNFRGSCLQVTITHSRVRYELRGDCPPLTIRHEDERLTVDEPVEREWRVPDPGPEPQQPPGRAPARRRPR